TDASATITCTRACEQMASALRRKAITLGPGTRCPERDASPQPPTQPANVMSTAISRAPRLTSMNLPLSAGSSLRSIKRLTLTLDDVNLARCTCLAENARAAGSQGRVQGACPVAAGDG